MSRRSTSKARAIDLAFPIRVKVRWRRDALPGTALNIENWALRNLGFGRIAVYPVSGFDCQAYVYLRSFEDGAQLLAGIPEIELAEQIDWAAEHLFTGGRTVKHSVGK